MTAWLEHVWISKSRYRQALRELERQITQEDRAMAIAKQEDDRAMERDLR